MHPCCNTLQVLLLSGLAVVGGGLSSACNESKQVERQPARPQVRTVEVMLEGRLVLTARNQPGPLRSTALPPSPDWKPPQHPFLTAQAHDANSESRLKNILDQSKDFDDYLRRLSKDGFHVKELNP
jgi:hypothetical protein